MKKSRWTVTFAAGLVVAGIGIGAAAYLASTQVEAQSTGLPATLAYMPATTTVVGHIDFTSLMSSPLREKWEEELERTGAQRIPREDGGSPNKSVSIPAKAKGVDLIFTMVSTTYRHTIAGM